MGKIDQIVYIIITCQKANYYDSTSNKLAPHQETVSTKDWNGFPKISRRETTCKHGDDDDDEYVKKRCV